MISCRICGFENQADAQLCEGCGLFPGPSCPGCSAKLQHSMKFCPNCGLAVSRDPSSTETRTQSEKKDTGMAPTEGERRRLTLVFCDLVGSTKLSQSLDPEDYTEVIHEYRKACGRCVSAYGGHIAQYFGDGMLVYFGFPVAFEDSPYRAVSAALDVLDSIEQLNVRLSPRFQVSLAVRIGIHVGLVVLERGGGGRERLAMGDAPNMAARLQEIASSDSVVISSSV